MPQNPNFATSAPRIAFVQASWHKAIVDQARAGFLRRIQIQGHDAHSVDVYSVPGAFEIPLQAKRLALSGRYAAIVAAGLVVDGGIYRHDFVASAVITGLMNVQLETLVPVFSVVLTPHHFHAGEEHQRFFHEHFHIKGQEAAEAVSQTLHVLQPQSDHTSTKSSLKPAASRAAAPEEALT